MNQMQQSSDEANLTVTVTKNNYSLFSPFEERYQELACNKLGLHAVHS